jgi:hypothetical protein
VELRSDAGAGVPDPSSPRQASLCRAARIVQSGGVGDVGQAARFRFFLEKIADERLAIAHRGPRDVVRWCVFASRGRPGLGEEDLATANRHARPAGVGRMVGGSIGAGGPRSGVATVTETCPEIGPAK